MIKNREKILIIWKNPLELPHIIVILSISGVS
jgi:hypothetical protein